MKTTLKEIKKMTATDVTNWNTKEVDQLYKLEKGFTTLAISFGVYGVNGVLVQGNETKELYKVTARNTNLYAII